MAILQRAQTQAEELCDEIKGEMAELDKRGEVLKQEAAERRKLRMEKQGGNPDLFDKGKGKANADVASLDDGTEDGSLKTHAEQEHMHKESGLKNRLREVLVVVHQIHFLLGDVYHVLGESYSASEDSEYAAAEKIRRELLKSTFISAASETVILNVIRDIATEATASKTMTQLKDTISTMVRSYS